MTLLQLEYALACYKAGSLAKAAKELYTSTSNMSRMIRSLEKELGYEVFVREASGAVASRKAIERGFFEHAEKVLGECGAIIAPEECLPEFRLNCSFIPITPFFDAFYETVGEYEKKGRVNFVMGMYTNLE